MSALPSHSGKTRSRDPLPGHDYATMPQHRPHDDSKEQMERYRERKKDVRQSGVGRHAVFSEVKPLLAVGDKETLILIRNQKAQAASGISTVKSGSSSLLPDVLVRNNVISSIYENQDLIQKQDSMFDIRRSNSSQSFNAIRAAKHHYEAQNLFKPSSKLLANQQNHSQSMIEQSAQLGEAVRRLRETSQTVVESNVRHSLPANQIHSSAQSHFKSKNSLKKSIYENQISQKEIMLHKLREKQQKYVFKQSKDAKKDELSNLLSSEHKGPDGQRDSVLQTQDSLYQVDELSPVNPDHSTMTIDAGGELERSSRLLMPAIKNERSINEFMNGGSSLLSSKLAKSKSINSPTHKGPKALDLERRRINSAIAALDNAEMTALENRPSDLHLGSFTVLKDALESVVLAPSSKKPHSIYSSHFTSFVQRSCNFISQAQQAIKKQLDLALIEKDNKIQELYETIKKKDQEIEAVTNKLKEEDDMFNDKKRQEEMKNLIQEFLDSHEILDAQIGGIFNGSRKYAHAKPQAEESDGSTSKTADRGKKKQFFDLNDLLRLSKYSGAKDAMQGVLDVQQRSTQAEAAEAARPATIDRELLDDDLIADFGGLMNNFLKDKAKDVQLSTSKRVIKQFLKNIQFEDACIQTGFNDDELIRELQDKVADLNDVVDDLRIDLHKVQAKAKATQDSLTKEKALAAMAAASVKNLTKRIEQYEAELQEEANATKMAKEALEREEEQTRQLKERYDRRKEDFIHKLADRQQRIDDALKVKIELLAEKSSLEAQLQAEVEASEQKTAEIGELHNRIQALEVDIEVLKEQGYPSLSGSQEKDRTKKSDEQSERPDKSRHGTESATHSIKVVEEGGDQNRTQSSVAAPGENPPATAEGDGSSRSQKKTEQNLSVHSERAEGDAEKDSDRSRSKTGSQPAKSTKSRRSREGSEPVKHQNYQNEPHEDYTDNQNSVKAGSRTHSKQAKNSSKGKSSAKRTSKGPKSQSLSKERPGGMDPRYSSLDVDELDENYNEGSEKPRLITNSSVGSIGTKGPKTTGFKPEHKERKESSQDEGRVRSIGSMRSQSSKKKAKKKAGSKTQSKLKQSSPPRPIKNMPTKPAEERKVEMKDQQTGCSLASERVPGDEDASMSKGTTYRRNSVDGDYNEYADGDEASPPAMKQNAAPEVKLQDIQHQVHPMNQKSVHINSSINASSELSASHGNELTTRYRNKNEENDAYMAPTDKLQPPRANVRINMDLQSGAARGQQTDQDLDIVAELKQDASQKQGERYQYYLEKPLNDLIDTTQKMQQLKYGRVGKGAGTVAAQIPTTQLSHTPQEVEALEAGGGGIREQHSQISFTPDDTLNVPQSHMGVVVPRFTQISQVRRPHVTQATQTTIDTQTFINILNINMQKAGTASVATQAVRYQGDLSYLTKRYGIHKFDFGQTVAPEQIKREFALFEVELKNKRIFAGQPKVSVRGGAFQARQQDRWAQPFAGVDLSLRPLGMKEDVSSLHEDHTMQDSIYLQTQPLYPDGAGSNRDLTAELESIIKQSNEGHLRENKHQVLQAQQNDGRYVHNPRVSHSPRGHKPQPLDAKLQSPIAYLKARNQQNKQPLRESLAEARSRQEESIPESSTLYDSRHQNMGGIFDGEEADYLRNTIEPASNVIVVKDGTSQSPLRGQARVRAQVSVGGSPTRPTIEVHKHTLEPEPINQHQVDFRNAREYYMRQQAATRKTK